MESSKQNHLAEEGSSKALPSLIKAITANELAGFDSVEEHQDLNRRLKSTLVHPLSTSIFVSYISFVIST